MVMEYTLITGATGGLGKAFVEICAARKENLLLTGRSIEKLQALRAEILEKHAEIDVLIFAADLSKDDSRYALTEKICSENIKIKRLINVAGADIQKAFVNYTQEKIAFQCRATFEGAVSLCHTAIKNKAESLEIIACLDLHQGHSLRFAGNILSFLEELVALCNFLACGACLGYNACALYALGGRILLNLVLLNYHYLLVLHVRSGDAHVLLSFVGDGHAVPNAVDSL